MKHLRILAVLLILCSGVNAFARYQEGVELYSYVQSRPTQMAAVSYDHLGVNYLPVDPVARSFDSTYSVSPIPGHYADGPNLYQYVRSNPAGYVDPLGLYAGVEAKRARAIMNSGIDGGHEWIVYPGSSKGFWPNRGYVVLDPDPAEVAGVPANQRWSTERKRFGKLEWGSGAGTKCKCATESQVADCVKAAPNPGWTSFPIRNNCRRYVGWVFGHCCLKKD